MRTLGDGLRTDLLKMFDPHDFSGSAITDADEARLRISKASGILLDWDGCAATANRPREDALSFIRKHRAHLAIVSNNSTLMPEDISEILMRAGVDFPGTRIFLAGIEALAYAAGLPGPRTLVLGNTRMKALARQVGMRLVQEEADVVVLLRDTKFSYAKLERAVQSLAKGARLIVSNPDATHPSEDGLIVPETGALLAAIGACVDLRRVNVQAIGKPASFLFERACAALKIAPENAVMVGDNRNTDVKGAHNLGMTAVLVAPGSELSFRELLENDPSAARRPAPGPSAVQESASPFLN